MADGGDAPGGEDAVRLRDELDAASAEIARLEGDAANAAAEAASLRGSLTDAQTRIEAVTAELGELRERAEATKERERAAAVRYRELVLRAEPALPADMIGGETIDAIDASVVAARDVVARVRSHMETQTSASRAPAGAPERSAPDLGAMTPQEKIRYGLEQRANA